MCEAALKWVQPGYLLISKTYISNMDFFRCCLITSIALLVGAMSYSQSAYRCKNVVEKSSKNYCRVYTKCGSQPARLVSEGPIMQGFILRRNYFLHRHGIWLIYDASGNGNVIDTIEYFQGFQVGEYEVRNPANNELVKYSIVKEGNCSITYFDSRGRKTQDDSFNLNEQKMTILKTFYNTTGKIIRQEEWVGKRLVKTTNTSE